MAGVNKAARAAIQLRREKAVKMRRDGCTWQQVVDALGYAGVGHASTDVERALKESRERTSMAAEELRQQELERLDDLTRRCIEIADATHPFVQGGEVITGLNGEQLADVRPILGAVDKLLAIMDRRAKLAGLDAPQQAISEVRVRIAGLTAEEMP